jgi:alpha-glucosidase
MWTDIDYMELRRLFTLDPERYPLELVRQLVDHLHQHQQHYILMVNSAIWRGDNNVYNEGAEMDVWQKRANGSFYEGAVWPGPTVFPDWFHPNTQDYWDGKFKEFFDPATGVDIDGLWNDMNEPANFCPYPCADPDGKMRNLQNKVWDLTLPSVLDNVQESSEATPSTHECGWSPDPRLPSRFPARRQRHETVDQLT